MPELKTPEQMDERLVRALAEVEEAEASARNAAALIRELFGSTLPRPQPCEVSSR